MRQKAPSLEELPALRVATLSSEWFGSGNGMRLANEGRSVDAILDALKRHVPDVLLVAGYSLPDDAALKKLDKALQKSAWEGLLFVEVHNHIKDLAGLKLTRQLGGKPDFLSPHCLFAWTRQAGWKNMGRQYFVSSDQAAKNDENRLEAFVQNLEKRTIEFKGRRFGALICGEINALHGRDHVKARNSKIEDWLRSLDVVVNATHDRMGNGGTLGAKRAWLSQGGRAYLSASNWNSRKISSKGTRITQYRDADTLHTFYFDGRKMEHKCPTQAHDDYEYREGTLPSGRAEGFEPARKMASSPSSGVARSSPRGKQSAPASSAPKGKAARPLWEMLKMVYPDVVCEAKFPWLALPRGDQAEGVEAEIRTALIDDCRKNQHRHLNPKKRECTPEQLEAELKMPGRVSMEFDFYIPSLNLAIEFDERQHFSLERAVSLAVYKGRVPMSFDVAEWMGRCQAVKAVDTDPIWRDWQRAYRDAIRDVRAARHGVRLVRYRHDAMPTLDDIKALARLEAMKV